MDNYYKLTPEQENIFAATFVLVQMDALGMKFDARPVGADRNLRQTLELLSSKNLIEERDGSLAINEAGKAKVEEYKQRFSSTLTYIDIFGYVDLQTGTFAFEKFGSFESKEAWHEYLADERWSDLRIAMVDHLDGHAPEFVFSQMTLEGAFSTDEANWQLNLTRGRWWRELKDICDEAYEVEELGYQKENGKKVSGEDVLDDVFEQGMQHVQRFYPNDSSISAKIKQWYPEEEGMASYGGAISTASSTSRPPWETAWTL